MQRLTDLLTDHLGPLDISKLERTTSLSHDLHCDGDDAAEFMASLAERFAIDFIDYDAYRYFNAEGYDLLKWRRPKHRRGSIPLTLAMLHHAIETRRWNTAELEALNA
ncbi:MAG TPA: DUF1493 family protein [Pseudomonas sp.]|nr:DUF1493 family protein [Pseudomonas sp.]